MFDIVSLASRKCTFILQDSKCVAAKGNFAPFIQVGLSRTKQTHTHVHDLLYNKIGSALFGVCTSFKRAYIRRICRNKYHAAQMFDPPIIAIVSMSAGVVGRSQLGHKLKRLTPQSPNSSWL